MCALWENRTALMSNFEQLKFTHIYIYLLSLMCKAVGAWLNQPQNFWLELEKRRVKNPLLFNELYAYRILTPECR